MDASRTLVGILILIAGLVLGYLGLLSYFLRYLKRHYNTVWASLGSPSLLLNNSLANNWLTLKFLLRREYSALDDPKATRLGNIVLTLLLSGWSLTALYFVLLQTSFVR